MSVERDSGGIALGGTPAAEAPHWLDAERVRGYSWILFAIFTLGFAVWIVLSLPDLVDPRGKPFGNDFIGFWSAAKLALAGHPEMAFDWRAMSAVQHEAVPSAPSVFLPWFYPPTFLLVVLPFGLLPYPAALALFLASTGILWALLLRRVVPDRRAWIVAAATPAGLITILIGQNGFLTAALAGFALLWLDRRPIAAGVLIGLLAVKPHLAALFPLALLAEGRWRTIVAASGSAIAFGALSLIAFGWGTIAAFVANLPLLQGIADRGEVSWGIMPSAYIFAIALGLPAVAAKALQGAAALCAAFCVWRVWRQGNAPFEAKAAALLAGSLLVSPYLVYYDLTWAALAVAFLAALGLRHGFYRGERELLLVAWLLPLIMHPILFLTTVQIGFPTVLLLLVVATSRADAWPRRVAGAA